MKYRIAEFGSYLIVWILSPVLCIGTFILFSSSVINIKLLIFLTSIVVLGIFNQRNVRQFLLRLMGVDTSNKFIVDALAEHLREEANLYKIDVTDTESKLNPSKRAIALTLNCQDKEHLTPLVIQLKREMGKCITKYGWNIAELFIEVKVTEPLINKAQAFIKEMLQETGQAKELMRLTESTRITYYVGEEEISSFDWSKTEAFTQ